MNLVAFVENSKFHDNAKIYVLTESIKIIEDPQGHFIVSEELESNFVIYDRNISMLSCIVGKNGSGKTSVLNKIFNFINNENKDYNFIFKEDNGKLVEQGNNNKKFFMSNGDKIKRRKLNERSKLDIIKYSSSIETNRQTIDDNLNNFDISTTSLLLKKNLSELNQHDMFGQVRFVLKNRESLQLDKDFINLSKKRIIINLSSVGEGIYSVRDGFLNDIQYGDFLKLLPEGKKANKMKKVLMLKFFSILFSEVSIENEQDEANDTIDNKESIEGTVILQKNEYKNEKKIINHAPAAFLEYIYVDLFTELCKKQNEEIAYIYIKKVEECFTEILNLEENGIFFNEKKEYNLTEENDLLFLEKIINNYYSSKNDIISQVFSMLLLEWSGVSSGEFALLNLFSRLSEVKEECKANNVLLLLDEVDLGLHPEWQRKWINTSLKFIGSIFKDDIENGFQLILTTHSPILLSDILKQDILFLNEDFEKELTFGQNIHTLFSKSFVVDDTIGEFSNNIIDIIADTLNKLLVSKYNITYNENFIIYDFFKKMKMTEIINKEITRDYFLQYISFLINSIGEDVIRIKLSEMLDNYFNKDNEKKIIQDKIKALEKELKRMDE